MHRHSLLDTMKFLICVPDADIDDTTDNVPQSERKGSNLRVWFNSVRNRLRSRKDRKVTISSPIPIPEEEAKQLGGLIEIKSTDDVMSGGDTIDVAVESDEVVVMVEKCQMVNAETNTEVDGEEDEDDTGSIIAEVDKQLTTYSWYWGNISRRDAENLLRGKDEGTFLVRDSSDKHFLYSLSFRSSGKTMHTRIEYCNKVFCFFSNDTNGSRSNDGSPTLGGLISDAMNQNNADNIFFYSRGLKSESSLYTVSLIQPLSRFAYLLNHDYADSDIKSLKYLCKFILLHSQAARDKLRQRYDSIPDEMQKFLEDSRFFPSIKKS